MILMKEMNSCLSSTQSETSQSSRLNALVRSSARCWARLLEVQSGLEGSSTLNLTVLVKALTEAKNLHEMLALLVEEQLPEEM